jgi:NCAIR mutase (PurE)-related protein
MQRDEFIKILHQYKSNKISDKDIWDIIENLPYEDISFAKIDHHRSIRWGFPEVLYCRNKTPEEVAAISLRIIKHKANLLATRASKEQYKAVKKNIPGARFNEKAGTIIYKTRKIRKIKGRVIVVTAGTSDLTIASETIITGEMLGLDMELLSDVGVAGIHRVMSNRDRLSSAAVIIVLAGMEGALASVIAGLVKSPVIAVPTSIGYGASFNGLTPLLGMLNSCVPGIAVMNIDNGFGAASLAFKILNTAEKLIAEK